MTVHQLVTNHEHQILIEGSIQFGSVIRGDAIIVRSLRNQSFETVVKDINNKDDGVTVLTIPMVSKLDEYLHGFIIGLPNAIQSHSKFTGRVRFLTQDQGGRSQSLTLGADGFPSYEVITNIHEQTYLVRPILAIPEDDNNSFTSIEPGSTVDLQIDLGNRYVPLELGYTFKLQEGAKVVAEGAVISLMSN